MPLSSISHSISHDLSSMCGLCIQLFQDVCSCILLYLCNILFYVKHRRLFPFSCCKENARSNKHEAHVLISGPSYCDVNIPTLECNKQLPNMKDKWGLLTRFAGSMKPEKADTGTLITLLPCYKNLFIEDVRSDAAIHTMSEIENILHYSTGFHLS